MVNITTKCLFVSLIQSVHENSLILTPICDISGNKTKCIAAIYSLFAHLTTILH